MLFSAKGASDPWKAWLKEVAPIMTKLEKEVCKNLLTAEDRKRYQEAFWQIRDPDPTTPGNELKEEYYRRLEYAKAKLNGPFSDRGKIYLLLGQPIEIKNFNNYEDLVECELWSYQNDGKPGLPPFINLLFFRYHDIGDLQLYYPGIHKPNDQLTSNC
jgi:GWxTD domain-containing protein